MLILNLNNSLQFPVAMRRSTTLVALLVQLVATLMVFLLAMMLPMPLFSIFAGAILQGVVAATLSYQLNMPSWWLPIHLMFTPALIAVTALALSPLWFLGAFLILVLVYGKTYQTQVPLYLSSQQAADALASLLPEHKQFSLVDLGCGCGGLLNQLSKTRSNGFFYGIEAAPIPFLLSKLRNLATASNCKIQWGDLWQHDLGGYDVVYAYLSPVPMEALWHKACQEMRPGSVFISNSFIVPGVKPEKSIKLNDFSGSTLYLWRI
jgi:hypothetical protein